MSSRGTFLDGHMVGLDDSHGWPTRIPATRIPGLLCDAKNDDDGKVRFALRWYLRDALQGAYDLLPMCDLCHEHPAFEDMGDGKTFCADCCSGAAGSKYDDRIED